MTKDEQIKELREALKDLLDIQNGPPLIQHAKEWRVACENGWKALENRAAKKVWSTNGLQDSPPPRS